MTISPELRAYAETPDRFAPVIEGSSVTRFADERVCIIQGATWAAISGVNVAADAVPSLLAEVRERIPPDRLQTWWMGPSTRPADLPERLLALGLGEPEDRAGLLHAMVLTEPPDDIPPGVEVRVIDTYEDFAAAREVQWEAFETPEERRAPNRARLREDFDESMELGIPVAFLATLDGRPAATGHLIPSDRAVFLFAGSTAPWARGRGLYRALVRARWDYAVERGTPALVVEATPDTSYPILQRLGFQEVCTIRRLEDHR
jgi:hypothetical protein